MRNWHGDGGSGMNREILLKAKRKDNGEWVEGSLLKCEKNYYICKNPYQCMDSYSSLCGQEYGFRGFRLIDNETICQDTGLTDKNGKKIWENDITKLVLSDREVRYFKVSFKKVARKVLCHPDFDDDVAKVELNSICFEWNGYELFPCIDDKGISDVFKMEIIGNTFDNPELLEEVE